MNIYAHPIAPQHQSPMERWMEKHDIHTAQLDAGIGLCWYAQQGDKEPVCGETEEEACAKLAREVGLTLWDA